MYKKFIISDRRKPSSMTGRTLSEETASDRSRVVFSSPIRRLQQKAQVFSLETNSSVRSRLTHSLEVADYGRLIAEKAAAELINQQKLSLEYKAAFVNIVETACLLHDIGNLPFGHFGETAIQEWFQAYWKKYYASAVGISENEVGNEGTLHNLMQDFHEFDGNPQGFRIITTLQEPAGAFTSTGLNLTKSQLYSFLKYIRVADGKPGDGIYKKAGYFNSEAHIVNDLQQAFGHDKRFPLTYIMEAADDMSYCLSDIEDGIEKGILLIRDFFEQLQIEWQSIAGTQTLPFGLDNIINDTKSYEERFFRFKIKTAQSLIDYAATTYVGQHVQVLQGEMGQLFIEDSDAHRLLDSLKNVSRKILFRSREAENNELAGHAVIYGLLERFSPLLKIPVADFNALIKFKEDPKALKHKRLDIELRLFNRLPLKYVEAYKYGIANHSFGNEIGDDKVEWYYRAHLIVDFIAGMTDLFALNLYKLLNGIEIQ